MASNDATVVPTSNADEALLAKLGYKQELKRGLSMLTNFGVSFCILSFPTGVTGSFATAWFWGGPVTTVWGWLIVTLMICGLVGPAMAEICSSYPCAGGLYYWAAKLGGKHGRIASWFAGWFNLLGQIAITSSVAMAATNSIIIMAVMASCPSKLNRYGGYSLDTIGAIHLGPSIPGYSRPEPCPFDGNHRPVLAQWAYVNATDGNTYYNGADGINDAGTQVFDIAAFPHHTVAYSDTECTRQPFNPTQPQVFGIFVGVMVCYGFINSVSIKAMDSMLKASIFIHIFGSLAIIIGLPIAAQVHQKKGLIWTRFQQGNWGASYGHGVTDSPYSSIYSGYLANDNLNFGGNGISATTDLQAGPHMFNVGMVTDSSSTTTGDGEPIFPINCDGHAPGSHNTGCIVRATYHQNFLHETNKHPGSGLSSANPYIFFCGMLMSQWSFTGYDASAHMVEETQNAAVAGPQGLFRALTLNAAFGFAYIMAIISSIQDYRNSFFGPLALNYNPVAQILFDVFEERTGDGRNGCGFWAILMLCMFLCGVSCLTSNARMLYAFARDGAVPGSHLWHTISPKLGIPVNAVMAMTIAAIAIAVPVCYSTTAYAAVTSITTIGLYISYVIPIVCRLTVGRKSFVPGPFYLGDKLSIFVHTAATFWVILICVIFVLPNTYPINMALNFNYAIIAVGVVLSYSAGTWFIPGPKPFNASKWFKGPNVDALDFTQALDGGPGASMHGGEAGYMKGGEYDDVPAMPMGV